MSGPRGSARPSGAPGRPTDSASGGPGDAEIQARIRQTLARLAQIDAAQVDVRVARHVVTLDGQVRCWSEWQLVDQVARRAPGVTGVHNLLGIGPPRAGY